MKFGIVEVFDISTYVSFVFHFRFKGPAVSYEMVRRRLVTVIKFSPQAETVGFITVVTKYRRKRVKLPK